MKKAKLLTICNWSLLVFSITVLASSIQLEATASRSFTLVILHIIVATIFSLLVGWHIYLNFNGGNWFRKFAKAKSPITRVLWWFFLFTVLSAIFALFHWLGSFEHSPIGGIHGKIGFIMIAIAIGHTIKRIKFFKKKRATK